ncbi:MAG: hypothetical protein QM702_20935 [Rubrivivax sp.]
MHRLKAPLAIALSLLVASACGGKKKGPDAPAASTDGGASDTPSSSETTVTTEKPDGGAPPAEKKDECVAFDVSNIEDALMKNACEEASVKPDGLTTIDLKGKLEVTLSASPTKLPAGAKGELYVTYANKSKEPLTLHFRINPVPYFLVEVYDKKGKRADMPAGNPPPPPKGASAPSPADSKAAKLTLAPNGSARARIPWEAVKMKWAPEKVRGTPAERGYPRIPNGPLPKGKYTVKVLTPLVGVSEGVEKEVSAPKVEIEVGG